MPHEGALLQAFWDLNTERRSDGMTLGRVPWSVARQYGREVFGFEGRDLDHFWLTIAKLDAAFLEWQRNEHDRYKRQNGDTKKPGSRQTQRRTYEREPQR